MESVEFLGTYEALHLPKTIHNGSLMAPSGRVKIQLDDGRSMALETHQLGIRTEDERQKFSGRRVKVRGLFVHNAQLWGAFEECPMVMDAIKAIEKLEAADNS